MIRDVTRWGAKWHSKNSLDGLREHIIMINYMPALFHTKKEAMTFIKNRYGYIAKRKDLRAEPFGWRMPQPIRVSISMEKQ